jgi:hypothetical protein
MENETHLIAWELFFIFIFSSLLIVGSTTSGSIGIITGRAVESVPSQNDVLAQIESGVQQLGFLNETGDFTMCIIVDMTPTTTYSFDFQKASGAISITNSPNFLCRGTQSEDIIISYVSYDALISQLNSNPTFDTFKNSPAGSVFYIYPSKQILPGMTLADPVDFNLIFGNVLKSNFNQQELSQIFGSQQPQASSPLPVTSYLLYLIIGLIVVILLVSGLIVVFSKKPHVEENLELISYIKASIAQGYSPDQVRDLLLQSGWKDEQIRTAFKNINATSVAP